MPWSFGEIEGLRSQVFIDDVVYNLTMFLGIPYVQPPVGDNRFRKPEPIESMESPFKATTFPNICMQKNSVYQGVQSEDCLYLNIYVPDENPDNERGHAVAIWIHGGGFVQGTANVYNASYLASYGNVIVVTINYRLGVFGFLSTEDDSAPGNYAFWDQHMAFKWVHDYIGSFGGDNQRVTIFGESAGSISVLQQALITKNRGYIHRVIAQSGTPFARTFPNTDEDAKEDARRLGMAVGCDIETSEFLMNCLRSKTTEEIMAAYGANVTSPDAYVYVIDNDLIKKDPKTFMAETDVDYLDELEFFRSLDVIFGFNSVEGMTIFTLFVESDDQYPFLDLTREDMVDRFKNGMEYCLFNVSDQSVIEMVMAEYTNWSNPYSITDLYTQLIKLYGDVQFGTPTMKTAYLHATPQFTSGSYLYYLTANPSVRPIPTPDWINGANHGDDIFMIFGIEFYLPGKDPKTTWEIQLSRRMIRYWTNFMKNGNPNGGDDPVWPKFDNELQNYMTLEENTTEDSVGQFLYARETNFWYKVFPAINEAIQRKPTSEECDYHTSSAPSTGPIMKVIGLVLMLILLI
ncbi:Carboxylesterase 5A [Mactra antiquata]